MLITQGHSEKDRIQFTNVDDFTATAIRKQNKEIEITVETATEIRRKLSNEPVTIKKILLWLYNLCILWGMGLIKGYFLVPRIKSNILDIKYYLIPVIIFTIVVFINTLYIIIKGGEQLRKNHGAEHMVLTAYQKLNRIPTVEETKHFSRICRTCGGTIYSALITGQIIGFILYVNNGIIISEKILFFIPFLLHFIFPFNFLGKLLQFITTKQPDDENIELAIAAIDALEHPNRASESNFLD